MAAGEGVEGLAGVVLGDDLAQWVWPNLNSVFSVDFVFQWVTARAALVSITRAGFGRSGGWRFGDVGRKGDTDGTEDRADIAGDGCAHGNRATVALDVAALEAIEIADQAVPFGLEADGGAAVLQLLCRNCPRGWLQAV